jgi:anaerobic selenocysteine-containing dehydrogenase
MEEFITCCPRNCYSTCSFRVQTENNRIHRILPYSLNEATPEGPCIKGLSYIERSRSEKRLKHPLLRTAGGWKQLTTAEAHKLAAERLSEIKTKYGSKSIFWYRGSGRSGLISETGSTFWKAFGGVTTTYGNLCWPAGLEAVRLTLGSVKHNVPMDLENAKTIVIWGKNPAETNIQEMSFIGKAKAKGATVIVVDPRRTPTADKADILFMPRPGTDAALALAVAGVLVSEDMVDENFIRNYVLGFDDFKNDSLMSPEQAESITGIPAEQVKNFARIIGKGSPVTFLPGYGLQRYSNGGQTVRSILALAVITGNLGKSGAGFNYANLQSYVFDTVLEPEAYYPDPEKDKPFRRSISMARLGAQLLATNDPGIRAIWVERGNPLLQAPDTNSVIKAFEKSEFTVVVDQFMTDTAKAAHLILPATDIFEQPDIVGSYWSPYVQYKPAILKAEGEIIPESEIYRSLADILDLGIPADFLPEPGNENADRWLEKRISGYSQLTLGELKKGPVLAPGLEEIAYSDLKFATPSGKIELLSERMKSIWNSSALPVYTPVSSGGEIDKFPLVLISPNTASRIHSQFGNLDVIKLNSDRPAVELSPEDAEARKISDGDRIRIFNSRGEQTSVARVSGRLPEGVVVMHNGIWLEEGGGSNIFTAPEETDIGFGAAFHGKNVQVEKAAE